MRAGSAFWSSAAAVPGCGLLFALVPSLPAALVGMPAQPQPAHVNPAFFGLLGPVILTLVVAFVLELRLLPLTGTPVDVKEAEADRRAALMGFALGGLLGAGFALGGLLASETVDESHYANSAALVRFLLGPALSATLILGCMVVAEAALPHGIVASADDARRRFRAIRLAIRRAIRRVRTVLWVGAVSVLTLVIGALAYVHSVRWLWGEGLVFLVIVLDTFANPSGAPVVVDRLVRPRAFVALVGLGLSTIVAASATLGAPDAGSDVAAGMYGFAAGALVALVVAFASARPTGRHGNVTVDEVARWTAAAAVGTVGLYAALLGAAETAGAFPFWGTVIGLFALVTGVAAYWRPFA